MGTRHFEEKSRHEEQFKHIVLESLLPMGNNVHGDWSAPLHKEHPVMHIGDRIVRQRKALGLTQQALAEKSGLPRSYIARLERHTKDNPTAHTLKRLARALGVSADYLIGLYAEEEESTTV